MTNVKQLLCLLLFFWISLYNYSAAQSKPNIIIIMADDVGYTDIGCYGGEILTPNLNSLAKNGLRFTQFYNMSRCCPTRASLLTGLYPHQAGVGALVSNKGLPGYQGDLSKESVTISEVLQTSGYETFMTGKWHVTRTKMAKTESDKYNWPLQRGFDRFYGTIQGAGNYFDPFSLTRDNIPISPANDSEYKPDTYYYTDAIADNSVKFIEERDSEKPFFLYVAFTAGHWPLHALPEDIKKYKGKYDEGYGAIRKARYEKAKKLGVIDEKVVLTPQDGDWSAVPDKEWEAACMEVYAAMIDRMDQGIGNIISTLKKENIFDNTLIIYLQDNGGCQETYGRNPKGSRVERGEKGEPMSSKEIQMEQIPVKTRDGYPILRGHVIPGPAYTAIGYGLNWANVSNTPFRKYKHYPTEGGISTPLIAHWPKGISACGELRHTPGHLIDMMSTVVEVSGATYPEVYKGNKIQPMEGRSLVNVFNNKPIQRDYLLWEHHGCAAIRVGDWKLVSEDKTKTEFEWKLYNMVEDRSEMVDLSSSHPGKADELRKLWFTHAKRTNILPRPNHRKKKKD